MSPVDETPNAILSVRSASCSGRLAPGTNRAIERMKMLHLILKFWFEETDSSLWWKKDDVFDALISERFSEIHASAARCELFEWRKTAPGRLAEIIVLDQF